LCGAKRDPQRKGAQGVGKKGAQWRGRVTLRSTTCSRRNAEKNKKANMNLEAKRLHHIFLERDEKKSKQDVHERNIGEGFR